MRITQTVSEKPIYSKLILHTCLGGGKKSNQIVDAPFYTISDENLLFDFNNLKSRHEKISTPLFEPRSATCKTQRLDEKMRLFSSMWKLTYSKASTLS